MTEARRNTTDSLDSPKDLVERRMVKTVAREADQLTGNRRGRVPDSRRETVEKDKQVPDLELN
jgi:hypothetical protein